MIQLKDIDRELADFLLDNVINKKGKPTYKEVAEELSKRLNRKINAHYNLAGPLGNVSSLCFELGLPLISARVIYTGATSSQAVGEGFYPFACEFRPEYKTKTPVDAWKNELRLIQDCAHWHRLKDYLDGIPVDTILSREQDLLIAEEPMQVTQKINEVPPSLALQNQVSDPVFPDEVDISTNAIKEGAVKNVSVNMHERNPAARKKCIEYYGTACAVCGIELGYIYGEKFSGKIHVHHLNPISDYDEEHDIDPINDIRPVCPNCHMVIHCAQDKPYSIEEVKTFMANAKCKRMINEE